MAADLAHTPSTGLQVQACGDCHLMNFGGFATPERRIVFDINDFDETLPAPWEWDLKRLATSFVVAGRHNRLTQRDTRDVAARVAGSYREHIRRSARMRVLERWYDQIGVDDLIETLTAPKWKRWVRGQVAKAVRRSAHDVEAPGLVTSKDGRRRIEDAPPLIVHQHAMRAQLLSQIYVQGIKYTAQRERPDGSNNQSFPSGHSASAFATASVLQRQYGWKVGVPAMVLAGYVATARVHDNKHYLSDVIFGASMGIAAEHTVSLHSGRYTWDVVPTGGPDRVGVMVSLRPR